jgi:glycosyltransferase involved in cell wall biosynthesis
MADLNNISFVMPVRDEEKYLRTAVESVFAQAVPGEMELILSVAPSKDQTMAIAKELQAEFGQKLQIVENPEGITPIALNLAIAKARYEVVLRVDAHSELSDGYASLAVSLLNQTGAANVGGMMVAKGKSDFQSAVAFGYNDRIGLGGGAFHVGGEAGPKETVYLGVFRKSVLDELGGFDPAWVRGQDWELNQRIRKAGYQVWFDPRLQVGYYPRSTWEDLARQFFKTGMWRGALTRNNPADSSVRYWIPPVLVLSLVWGLPLALYLMAIGFYVFTRSGPSNNVKAWLMVVLPTMHFAWGLGFWWGLFRGVSRG